MPRARDRFHELTGAPVRAFGRGHDDLRRRRDASRSAVSRSSPSRRRATRATPSPSCCRPTTPCSPATRSSAAARPSSPGPTAASSAYLASLDRIESLTRAGVGHEPAPGHGPFVADAAATVTFYLRHRAERLDQVRDAVARGAQTAYAVVEQVYADVPRSVWPAAELSVQAQLEYLRTHG